VNIRLAQESFKGLYCTRLTKRRKKPLLMVDQTVMAEFAILLPAPLYLEIYPKQVPLSPQIRKLYTSVTSNLNPASHPTALAQIPPTEPWTIQRIESAGVSRGQLSIELTSVDRPWHTSILKRGAKLKGLTMLAVARARCAQIATAY
jgi:hypothetical protein